MKTDSKATSLLSNISAAIIHVLKKNLLNVKGLEGYFVLPFHYLR